MTAMNRVTRRDVLRTLGAAAACGLTTGTAWPAGQAEGDPDALNTLARWLADTPRGRIVEGLVERIRGGLEAGPLAAAITQAASLSVQPYPDVGFKYHAVLGMQAVQRASVSFAGTERWLPLFWAADYLKQSQAAESRQTRWGGPTMLRRPPAREARARRSLVDALESWDRESAEAAVVAYADTGARDEVFDLLFRYAARDFRSIGHKTIAACNAHRMLPAMGWANREAILRSLAAAVQNHEGDPNPATDPGRADRAWIRNREHVETLPARRAEGDADPAAARDFLQVLRSDDRTEAADLALTLLRRGVSPASLDDRLLAARKVLAYLQEGGDADALATRARRMTVYKTVGVHDYKFTEALIENAVFVAPPLRPYYLASGTLYYNGPDDRDNPVISQTLSLIARA